MREPEPETIARAQGGDLGAFELLVRAYQADVWRFAYHLTRNRATADDVAQEAFLHAFRALGQFRGSSKFTSWLLRITRNCAIDAYRRTRREAVLSDDMDTSEERSRETMGGTSPTPTSSEDRIRIAQAVRGLPMDLREPFVVIEVLGFNYQEASAVLGVKIGTVKSRMHRARAFLMEALGDEEAAGEV